jgi:negative regulator of sigma-B (phosphoserine phosphatase)
MSAHGLQTQPVIEWGFAVRAAPGESVSGDVHLVQFGAQGALAAVVDGLGHGEEAARVARTAAALLQRDPGDSLIHLVTSCHSALISTRGAVMTLASFNELNNTVSCLGVGNVEAVLLRAGGGRLPSSQSVLLLAGVVGYQLPLLRTTVFEISHGDLLILASDGISGGFHENVILSDGSQQIADRILREHFKGTDDALVLVIRYLGTNA